MLKSMCYSSEEARQKFPRLLQIVHKYPDTLEAFVKKVSCRFQFICLVTDIGNGKEMTGIFFSSSNIEEMKNIYLLLLYQKETLYIYIYVDKLIYI